MQIISSKILKMSRRRQKIAVKRRLQVALASQIWGSPNTKVTRIEITRVLRESFGPFYADVEVQPRQPVERIQLKFEIIPYDKQQPQDQVEADPV